MPWTVKLLDSAVKSLDKIDRTARQRIERFIENRLLHTDNPRQSGKALTGQYAGLWRYRIGDYRVICQLQDEQLILLVVKAGHRSDVYRGKP